MQQSIKNILLTAKQAIQKSKNINELELIRVRFLGKNGIISKKVKEIKYVSIKEKPIFGLSINQTKKEIEKLILEYKNFFLEKKIYNISKEKIDVSLSGRRMNLGRLHPISYIINYIHDYFIKLGFFIVYGPEIEDDYHNFQALNISTDHPSRTDHDTFWFNKNKLLRTQTSCMQIRIMKNKRPPIKIITSGRVYRNDYDRTHTPMFHQIEGLIVDKEVNFTNLKYILYNFLYNFFSKKVDIRFRPSYFPFTKMSAEIDILNKNNSWLEIIGCGLVHPKVLSNVNIDHNVYSGLAFGIGVERLAMLYYSIDDSRNFFENDLRFLQQFK